MAHGLFAFFLQQGQKEFPELSLEIYITLPSSFLIDKYSIYVFLPIEADCYLAKASWFISALLVIFGSDIKPYSPKQISN